MWQEIWNYQLQIVPVLLFLAIYETPAFLRRLNKTFYVPIYFSVYPLRQINQNLASYLGDDVYVGEEVTADEAEAFRKQIIAVSAVSAIIDAVLVPLMIGLVAAFLLTEAVFYQFIAVLLAYKVVTVTMSLLNSDLHLIEAKWKTAALSAIYMLYLGLIFEMSKTAFFWAEPYVASADWAGLWSAFSAFVFGKILAQGIVFAGAVAIFTNFIADRKIREKRLSGDE
jgi:hypothetical protein